MMMVVEYKVLYSGALSAMPGYGGLEELVNNAIRDGWQPQGGVYQDRDGDYLQAMVRYHMAPSGVIYLSDEMLMLAQGG